MGARVISPERFESNPAGLTPEKALWANFFNQVSSAVKNRKDQIHIKPPFKAKIVDSSADGSLKIIRTIQEYSGGAGYEWIWQVQQVKTGSRGDKEIDMDMSYWTGQGNSGYTEVTFVIFPKGLVAYGKRLDHKPGDDEERLTLSTEENKVIGLEHLAVATANGLILT